MIFDHLLRFADEADARQALPQLYNAEGGWDGSRVIAPISIITAEAEGETPEQTLPGFWLAIALPELSTELRDLPNEACRLIADRVAANAGQSFIRYLSPSVDPQIIATARVAPIFAGSRYPFGSGA